MKINFEEKRELIMHGLTVNRVLHDSKVLVHTGIMIVFPLYLKQLFYR